jgi:hypothetical protein
MVVLHTAREPLAEGGHRGGPSMDRAPLSEGGPHSVTLREDREPLS